MIKLFELFAIAFVLLEFDGRPDGVVLDTVVDEDCVNDRELFNSVLATAIEHHTNLPVVHRIANAQFAEYPDEFVFIEVGIHDEQGWCIADIQLQDGYLRGADQWPTIDGQYSYSFLFQAADFFTVIESVSIRASERAQWTALAVSGRQ
jgi:hypothetical protein